MTFRQPRPVTAGAILLIVLLGCQAQPGQQSSGSRRPTPGGQQNRKPGGKAMVDLFFEIPLEESTKIEIAATPIRPSAAAALPKAAAPADAACARPFCNDEWNSRLGKGVPAVQWPIRWETALNPKFPPSYIAQAGDRILVEGGGQWQLFDRNGKMLSSAAIKSGQSVMDPAHALIYAVDQDGALSAYRFADGRKVFTTSLAYGDTFWRQFLARSGSRLIILGVEQEAFPHRPTPPNKSVIEVKELADPLRVDPSGQLLSVRDAGNLRAESSKVTMALHAGTLAFAVPDRIYLVDLNLKVGAALEESFEPVVLSLDEAGRVYLIAKRGEQLSLWVITPQGQRVLAYDLPPEFGIPSVPPIVGYDHRIYLTGAGRTLAINPDGKLAWEQPMSGPAAVTADDQLLVASGSVLVAFDGRGNRRVIRDFQGDVLKTPPITASDGDILVASAQRLYRLTPLPR